MISDVLSACRCCCAWIVDDKTFFRPVSFGAGGGEQAEHDTEARPILVSTSETLVKDVNACLKKRLAVLPTRDTAMEAVKKGFAVVCKASSRESCSQSWVTAVAVAVKS